MSPESRDLLNRIEAFPIDGPEPPALPFAARLAREQGWSRPFAERAVREYRRFVFLAVTAGRPMCPSEQVDAVWHLHLTYTRSYWKRFCGDTLGRPLHHEPTRGGGEEADKHLRMYADTLAEYRKAFGHEPPADLWPEAGTRFGDDTRHVVVHTKDHWVVSKKRVWRAATAALVAAGVTAGLGCGGLNPFELVGTDFLVFLVPMLLAALAVGLVIRNTRTGPKLDPDEPLPDLTWSQAALLAGHTGRLFDAAIARLIQSGTARVSADESKLEKGGPPADELSPVERLVYDSLPLARTDRKGLARVRTEIETRAAADERRLQAEELVLEDGRAKSVGRLAFLPFALVLFGLGGARLLLGLLNDKPVVYLVITLVVSLVVGGIALGRRLRLTHKGQAVLDRFQDRRADLKTANSQQTGYDPALAVALFGTTALLGTEYAMLQRWYPRPTNADGGCGSGCGGSGCGGGGGGGGCGSGCGGCGGGD